MRRRATLAAAVLDRAAAGFIRALELTVAAHPAAVDEKVEALAPSQLLGEAASELAAGAKAARMSSPR